MKLPYHSSSTIIEKCNCQFFIIVSRRDSKINLFLSNSRLLTTEVFLSFLRSAIVRDEWSRLSEWLETSFSSTVFKNEHLSESHTIHRYQYLSKSTRDNASQSTEARTMFISLHDRYDLTKTDGKCAGSRAWRKCRVTSVGDDCPFIEDTWWSLHRIVLEWMKKLADAICRRQVSAREWTLQLILIEMWSLDLKDSTVYTILSHDFLLLS